MVQALPALDTHKHMVMVRVKFMPVVGTHKPHPHIIASEKQTQEYKSKQRRSEKRVM